MGIAFSDFTSGQVTFIRQLTANIGLDGGVVAAWVYAEENGSAAQSRQAANNNDWLNVGYTDSATLGAGNSVWSNPSAAANATANWIKGTWVDPGFGASSPGIRTIPSGAGKAPAAQIGVIQRSGWATSGYPDLPGIYASLDLKTKQAFSGGVAKGGIAAAGGSGTVPDGSTNTTYPFSISGTQNPDEDYWTGINRLAQEVNWYLYSNAEYLYYMDGQEMLAQKPAVTLDRLKDSGRIYNNQATFSWDDTAFNYVSDHKRKFRPQRRTKVAIAQSPTEVSIQLICGIDEIRGGDLVELTNYGIADGRWIVAECRRSVFAVYSELTLVPALAPITEAAAAGTTGASQTNATTSTNTATNTGPATHGTLALVVSLAQRAVALQASQHCYTYTQVNPARTNDGNGVLSPPYSFDCSGFVETCYKYAGLGDPAGSTNYAGTSFNIGGPGPHSDACVQIGANQAVPGDLVVFPNHVVIYTGNGNCISMGGPGDPTTNTVANEASYENRGVTGYFHLRGAS